MFLQRSHSDVRYHAAAYLYLRVAFPHWIVAVFNGVATYRAQARLIFSQRNHPLTFGVIPLGFGFDGITARTVRRNRLFGLPSVESLV